jgi:ABC-type glycerol-3-phosphate transport system substrate-binding protein
VSRRTIRTAGAAAAVVALAVIVAAVFGGTSQGAVKTHKTSAVNTSVKGNVSFDGIWTSSTGQKPFQKVINAFHKKYPGVHVNYKPVGNNLPTVLATAVAGGHPPDMADIAQPGTIKQFANQHKLKPINYATSVLKKNFSPGWLKLGKFNGKQYAFVFKAANKSLVWYNVPAFKTAGVKAPKTFSALLKEAKTIKASGTPAYSIGGAEGWTLTDLFENIYLRTFGVAKYNALSAHKIKWTDSSVTTALKSMGKILGDTSNIAGGTAGALQDSFNQSVTNAFASPSKGAMVFEADFVGGVILSQTKAKPKTGFNTFVWPQITAGADAKAVEIAGDLMVTFRDNPAIRAFVKYLASPKAASIWAHAGGFGTGNHNMKASVYPDSITRATEAPLLTAKSVVFDMSDLQPPAFGSTAGQGEWGLFQKFLQNPSNINAIQKDLEKAAASAYKH